MHSGALLAAHTANFHLISANNFVERANCNSTIKSYRL